MKFAPLPFDAPLADYERQAAAVGIDLDALAHEYCFLGWAALTEYAAAVANRESPTYRSEVAVEAVIDGDTPALRQAIERDPAIVHARSTRRCPFDPPVHRATLLHYLAANGVENHRQRTPPNAMEVLDLLLDAGADPNSTASLYGGKCTVLSMLVSSGPPAEAKLQTALAERLIERGASVEPLGTGHWTSPVATALAFGFVETAEMLVRHGAKVDLPVAAGLGRIAEARELLPEANALNRHRALALAAQLGRTEIVELLLDAGEDPDRFNPPALHAHATPLHHAALYGHEATVRLLVERGARIDIPDRSYRSAPAGWAEHNGHLEIARYLRERALS
ncbi:MAG: ankyrin repeat domain-containing protein [Bryobacteraceae bacterium]|nr:ankyrin repeat domain-containing protein [Bryobacteraceae bacterium]